MMRAGSWFRKDRASSDESDSKRVIWREGDAFVERRISQDMSGPHSLRSILQEVFAERELHSMRVEDDEIEGAEIDEKGAVYDNGEPDSIREIIGSEGFDKRKPFFSHLYQSIGANSCHFVPIRANSCQPPIRTPTGVLQHVVVLCQQKLYSN